MSDVLTRICADKRAHIAESKNQRGLEALEAAARSLGAW